MTIAPSLRKNGIYSEKNKMKIRSGFVSNSSSSSFCISEDAYENVFEVALAMIPIRDWPDDKKLMAKIRKAMGQGGKKSKKSIDPNTPICFTSCNEDTHIFKHEGYYFVSTCHNHPFMDALEGQTYPPKELQEEMHIDDCWFEELWSRLFMHGDFWYPEYDIMACPDDDYNHCEECYTELLIVQGETEKTCPICLTEGKKK